MPRKNHRPNRPQRRRVPVDQGVPRALRGVSAKPVPIDKMVLPKGRCFFRSKKGKLIFSTKADAEKALVQAKANRKRQTANGHVECRFYECPEGGCGGFHLTSREQYEDRTNVS
jgi:hypothetical protein